MIIRQSEGGDIFFKLPVVIIRISLNQDKNDGSFFKLASNYLEIDLFTQFSEPVFMINECKENNCFDWQRLLE